MKNRFLAFAIAAGLLLVVTCVLAVFFLAPLRTISAFSARSGSSPTLIAEPAEGGPDTLVTLKGSGFPANTRVTVHLGPPNVGATPNSYGEALTDAQGDLMMTFKMPAAWPDGTAITEPKLIIGAPVGQGEVKAMAEFTYKVR